jgi:signal transduction histidine kinase
MPGRRLLYTLLCCLFAGAAVAGPQQPARILILHSFGPDFGDHVAKDLRAELGEQFPGRLELYDEWLVSARFPDDHEDAAFAAYLRTLFAARPLDLVITLDGPAAKFALKYREQLFPHTPKILAAVEERQLVGAALSPTETLVATSVSFPDAVDSILRLLPDTRTVAVVIGNSALERYWVGELRESLGRYSSRVQLLFLNELAFGEVLRRASTLPAHSAIMYMQFSPQVDGIPQDEDRAFAELHTAASAPLFSIDDAYLGQGIVGGPLISESELSERITAVARRLLQGEPAAQVRTAALSMQSLGFDSRELKRWGISESRLPAGSLIRFRAASTWQRYPLEIGAIAVVMALLIGLVAALLGERRRRNRAEIEAHHRLGELAHMNRRAAAGELSASIAHELGQPLGAILRNSEAAELILDSDTPDLTELREILADIRRDDERAAEVIRRLRRLLTSSSTELQELDLNEVAREVFQLVGAQAAARRVGLSIGLSPQALRVSGDRVQLQQVILNLVMNGMDAIVGAGSTTRQVSGNTRVAGEMAEVSISDSGPGIPGADGERIFAPFFTTKESGMGMGLAIARTIIESHGGRIWVDARSGQGAILRFSLPLVRGSQVTVRRPAGTWSSRPAPVAEGSSRADYGARVG